MEQTGPQTTHPQLVDVDVALQLAGEDVEEPRQRKNTAAQPMQLLPFSIRSSFTTYRSGS
jgi:hypothetical protein